MENIRQVLLLRHDAGLSYRMIGAAIGVSRGTNSNILRALRRRIVGCISTRRTASAWYHGRRLVAPYGTSSSLPDEQGLREAFGLPGSSRGSSAFPKLRVSAPAEVGTRVRQEQT